MSPASGSAPRRPFAVTNPVDDSVIGHVPKLGVAETRRALEAAERRAKALGEENGQRARRPAAQMVQPDDGESGRPRAHHDRRAGQAAGRVTRRDRLWRIVRRILRRRGQADLWRDDPLAVADIANAGDQAAARRRRGDHALELSQRDDHPQGGPSPRRRLRLRLQTGDRDAAFGARAGGAGGTGRHPARRFFGADRRLARDRRRDDLQPDRARTHLHRLDRGRPGADGAMRADDQEARSRTRRQRSLHRLRRRRSRCGGPGRDGLEIPQRRPDLRMRQPLAGAGERLRRLRREARRGGQEAEGRGRRRGRRDHRPADQPGRDRQSAGAHR